MIDDANAAARHYIESGIAPVPVLPGKKGPNTPGWQTRRFVPEDFKPGGKVGLNLGLSGMACVDGDTPAAAWLIRAGYLDAMLGGTTLKGGRPGNPGSHAFYRVAGIKHRTFYDVGGKKPVVEILAGNHQVLVPPSVHPESGEPYDWADGEYDAAKIMAVDAARLERGVRELATAALIARHMPDGGRHNYALALAGLMRRDERLDHETVERLFVAAWRCVGAPAPHIRDAVACLEDTEEKLQDRKPATGGPSLDEIVPGLPKAIRDVWGWSEGAKRPEGNAADRLIAYAQEAVGGLFVDQHGAPHALVDGAPVPLSPRAYPWLINLMWEREHKSVGRDALKTAADTLAAFALNEGRERELHTRAAWHDGTLYYELRPGRVVKVSAGQWSFADNAPVLFRRLPNLKALPDPVPDGKLEDLAAFANLKAARDRRLFLAYAVTLVLPQIARPILLATGPAGSGKSTTSRVLKRLLDPTDPEAIRMDPRDFLQKASHAHIVMLDNASHLSGDMADSLCRLVTGEADSKRKLYSDDDDVIYSLKRAILLNGINVPTGRNDLLDRSLIVGLDRIGDTERRGEGEMWAAFDEAHPKLLGTVFDTLAKALLARPYLVLERTPRLADWGAYAAAVYDAAGWHGECGERGAALFEADWSEIVESQDQAVLDGSALGQAVIAFMEERPEFNGTPSELHDKLTGAAVMSGLIATANERGWPTARTLGARLREISPMLANAGIAVVVGRTKHGRYVKLTNSGVRGDTNRETLRVVGL